MSLEKIHISKHTEHRLSGPPVPMTPQQLANDRNNTIGIFVDSLQRYETVGTDYSDNQLEPDELQRRIEFVQNTIQSYLDESASLMDPTVVENAQNALGQT